MYMDQINKINNKIYEYFKICSLLIIKLTYINVKHNMKNANFLCNLDYIEYFYLISYQISFYNI